MKQLTRDRAIQLITLFTFVLMVTVNGLANALPINGVGTGEVSDSYPDLFAPIGFTFAIWGVIYTLLLGFTAYQIVAFFKKGFGDNKRIRQVAILFSFSSVVNSAWIFAWHYRVIWFSLILMAILLISLIAINLGLKKGLYSRMQRLLVKLPFSVYFGWITVASIANVTTFLVDIQWGRFGIPEDILTVAVLTVGAAIGIASIKAYNDIPFGLVVLWAYSGILAKHLSPEFFNGSYPVIIVALIGLMIVVAGVEVYMLIAKIKRPVNV